MPALYDLKPWFTQRLNFFIQAAGRKGISPDIFTAVGLAGAAIAAVGMNFPWPPWAICLWVFIFGLVIRLGGANLDGAVARARGVSRPLGFVFNELGDRLSDFILFVGLYCAVMPALHLPVLSTAMISSLPTLVAISAAAVGAPRFNGGPLGKTERCILFSFFPLCFSSILLSSSVLALMSLGALVTVVKRIKLMQSHLQNHGTLWQDTQPTVVKLEDDS